MRRTPQRTIGQSVNLSAAAVQRRIAALEAANVIQANVARVDHDAYHRHCLGGAARRARRHR
ncbi:winged helix-turn-helix transcriptional regulator [Brevundimonas sp. NPDC055814]|uniref:Lrp/AsnC family transcriptional regulator n=1 Tax=Brevundimonas TaxID=41275 RepID=UPI0034583023